MKRFISCFLIISVFLIPIFAQEEAEAPSNNWLMWMRWKIIALFPFVWLKFFRDCNFLMRWKKFNKGLYKREGNSHWQKNSRDSFCYFSYGGNIMVKYDFNRKQTTILCVVLFCLILLSIPLTSFLGSANLSARQIFKVYGSKIDPTRYASIQKNIHNIVWELRLPRAILSILACVWAPFWTTN